MFAKPMERDPPASCVSPRWPRKSIEIIALEYKSNPVIAVGHDILPIAFISSITWNINAYIKKKSNSRV
jgi:hypothetical protein